MRNAVLQLHQAIQMLTAGSMWGKLRKVEVLDYLTEGIRYDRPLIWKNGDRPYRITDLQVEQGRLVLRIHPL